MENTIYKALGEDNLELLVNEFYDRVQENPVISHLFKTDIDIVKQKQKMFLTQFLGGPPLYNQTFGHPRMRMRHMPHAIDEKAKDAWLECMKESINTLPITDELKNIIYNCFPKLAVHMMNR
jgi:hemoglobin